MSFDLLMYTKPLARANLSEQLYRDLRQALMDGHFRPGQRLTVAGIADQYGTSITPVREAISKLASERALEVRAATSILVPKLTPEHLREIIAVRIELEGMAAHCLTLSVSTEEIDEFETLNSSFAQAAASNPELASRLNRDFHFKILKLARMPYIESICENMWTLMGPFIRTLHEETPARTLTDKDHQHYHFIKALKAGNADAAKHAMQEDIRLSYAQLRAEEAAMAQGETA